MFVFVIITKLLKIEEKHNAVRWTLTPLTEDYLAHSKAYYVVTILN